MKTAAPIIVLLAALLPLATAEAQITTDTKPQPGIHTDTKLGLANRFKIQIDGIEIAQFSEASINARAKPPTVTLKRGKNTSMEMWAWHEAARMGDMTAARKSAMLVMYDYDGKPVARYHLENAWPSKIELRGSTPALDAGGSKVAVETLEIAHPGLGEASLETVTLVCDHIQRVSP